MAHPFVFAAAVALFASGPAETPSPLVQAVKSVCKSNLADPAPHAAVCHGGGGRLSEPTVCFCSSGMKVDLPACWQDGRPAMHPKDRDFTSREYDSFVACGDLGRH